LSQRKLKDEQLFPVCSPKFNHGHLPRVPAELATVPLLRHIRQPWTPWFRAAGLTLTEPTRGLSFNEAGGLLQAAAQGYGVALARATMALDDLRRGQLMRLFEIDVLDRYAWYAVWLSHNKKSREITQFCNWLEHAMRTDGWVYTDPDSAPS
jgi:LysR family glycine cleavage system transcriptional activator